MEQSVRSETAENFCIHCGLAVPTPFRLAQQRRGIADTQFCCSGCECVYQVIHGLGLDEFYNIRKRLPPEQPVAARLVESEFKHFADPEFQKEFVETNSEGLSRVELFLEGIHCAACVWLLEKLPHVLQGVSEVRVNFGESFATIIYDANSITLPKVAETINSLGYIPHPRRYEQEAAQRLADRRTLLLRIGVAGLAAGNTMMVAVSMYQGWFTGIAPKFSAFFHWFSLLVSVPAVFYSALPFYRAALGGLRARMLHIDLPISLGILAGFFASVYQTLRGASHVYYDSICALIFLLLIGRFLQRAGIDKAIQQTELLYVLSPNMARRCGDQGIEEVYTNSLQVGDVIEVRPGETFAADGLLMQGTTKVDRSVLTGESRPIACAPGDKVFAGTKNIEAEVLLRVDTTARQSRLGKLMRDLEHSAQEKSGLTLVTDKIAGWFVLVVLLLAVGCAVFWSFHTDVSTAIEHTLALLVISCPCALGLAAPISMSIATRAAARRGVFIKNTETIEQLCLVDTVYLDKTGTLTKGAPSVASWHCASEDTLDQAVLISVALEEGSTHPLAHAIRNFAAARQIETGSASELMQTTREIPGKGVQGTDGKAGEWRLGSLGWVQEHGAALDEQSKAFCKASKERGLSPIALTQGGRCVAFFAIGDALKDEARGFVSALEKQGIKCSILSGDYAQIVALAARQLGISADRVRAELSPEEKVSVILEDISASACAMIGDGVNDAAAFAAADVGIAVQGGAEASLRSADIFVNSSNLNDTRDVFEMARRTIAVIRRNLVFSLAYNMVGASLALAGMVSPLLAAVLMPLSSLTVVLSSLSLYKKQHVRA